MSAATHTSPRAAAHFWVFVPREHGYACLPAEILSVNARHMRVRTVYGRTLSLPVEDYACQLSDEERARYYTGKGGLL